MTKYNGPFDVINKVLKVEGFRGLYRGFGLTILTQSPASALWWGAYGAAQHAIWRCLHLLSKLKFAKNVLYLLLVGMFEMVKD